MKIKVAMLPFLGSLILVGCTTIDVYKFSQNEKRATITGGGPYYYCIDGSSYTKMRGVDAFVPTDRRINFLVIESSAVFGPRNVCETRISFIPKEGEIYFLNSYFKPDKCYIEALRLDSSTETGVALIPSVGPGAEKCE